MLMGGWGTRYLISPLLGFSSAGVTRYSLRGVLGAEDALEEGKGFSKAVGVTPFESRTTESLVRVSEPEA
jgi:hypothetical protein